MENQPTDTPAHPDMSRMTPLSLTEQHLDQWLRLLDHLQDRHAPFDQLSYCRRQVMRLQLDLYQVRNTEN